jgi:hypothetical protein
LNFLDEYSYGYPIDEKSIPPQQQLDVLFSPVAIPPLATLNASPMFSATDHKPQDITREALLENPAPVGVSFPPQQEYKPSAQESYTLDSSHNNTYNTNDTYLTQNTSDLYDPGQREVNHLSYLSSLSSGFGDAQIIIPESGPMNQNPQIVRQSGRQSRKFSWVSSGMRRQGERDTIYTTSSEDSAPRFRTINSWVAQQTGRVERRRQSDHEVPNMPQIPLTLQIGVDHQRKASEDPAFRHHPGEEVEFSKGSRVPSVILDRKTGFN